MIKRLHLAALIILCSASGAAAIASQRYPQDEPAPLICDRPTVTDGDSLRCNGQRVRLLGIDAPEMPGSCRPGRQCVQGDPYAARDYLVSLTRTTVRCRSEGQDRYGRTLARCTANGTDLSCAMIRSGHAVRRYANIRCR